MGFLDKAKQMAEQAQAKLDEAQKQFNARQAPGQDSPEAAVEYQRTGQAMSAIGRLHGSPARAKRRNRALVRRDL